MVRAEHTSDAHISIGIDVSKHQHEVVISIPENIVQWPMVANALVDFHCVAFVKEQRDQPISRQGKPRCYKRP